ncbi:hypothetical protein OAO18_04040 [Francisellaceae bacterium]|nr:hypothetical protein [Francisellaceae bacterium]
MRILLIVLPSIIYSYSYSDNSYKAGFMLAQNFAVKFDANLQKSQIHQDTAQKLEQLSINQSKQLQDLQESDISAVTNKSPSWQDFFLERNGKEKTDAYFTDPNLQQTDFWNSEFKTYTNAVNAAIQSDYHDKYNDIMSSYEAQVAALKESSPKVDTEQFFADISAKAFSQAEAADNWKTQTRQGLENISNPDYYINKPAFPDFNHGGNYSANPMPNEFRDEVTSEIESSKKDINSKSDAIAKSTGLDPQTQTENDLAFRRAIFNRT